MKLNVMRLGSTLGIVWGMMAFLTGIGNLALHGYGTAFLKVLESLYPGYTLGKWGFGGVIVLTLYAALDGFVLGVVIAWVHNLLKFEKK